MAAHMLTDSEGKDIGLLAPNLTMDFSAWFEAYLDNA
jgi:hypothetical protein